MINIQAQKVQNTPAALLLAGVLVFGLPPHARSGELPPISRAQADYLRALNLADEGSKPEALRVLAESLRLQPRDNPASALVFELLTELRTNSRLLLRGHTDGILYAAYSPDGSKIVTASEDHTARIWEARTGLQLGPALQHGDEVRMAEFSPDGTRVVTASEDRTARVWDVQTGQAIGTPMQGTHDMLSARFRPTASTLSETSPGPGSRAGTSAKRSTSGPPSCSKRMALIDVISSHHAG